MENTKSQKKSYSTASSKSRARRKTKTDYYDYSLVAVIVLLTCFGLIMLYSTSSYMAQINYGSDMYFFKKQAIISVACIIMALIISRLNYRILNRFSTALYVAALVLMALVKTPLGQSSHGAQRWLNLGPVQFQPAELAKIAVIVCLPYMIVHMGKKVRTLKGCMVLAVVGGGLALAAYVFTDNLSTAIIVMAITVLLLFLVHPKTKRFVVFACVVLVLAVIVVVYLKIQISDMATSTDFRMRRIIAWLNPEANSDKDSYQFLQGLYAIGSGGFFGKGLGNSTQKLSAIPEAQNDMILTVICEELGVFGAILILCLFGFMLYRLMFIARNAPDLYGSLIAAGIFSHIALQVILNIAVVTGLIPTTGVTLPFISYGGTAVVFLLAEMGIALGISSKIELKD